MTPIGKKVLLDILVQSALIFLLLAAIFALAYGIALVMNQAWALRLNDSLSRWVSTHTLQGALDRNRDLHRLIYRRHRLVGVVLVVCAATVLWVILTRFNPHVAVSAFRRFVPPFWMSILVETLWWVVVPANAIAVIVGLVMIGRPSALKRAETWANREFSTDRISRLVDSVHAVPDHLAQTRPRLIGTVIIAASAYVCVSLGMMLLARGG